MAMACSRSIGTSVGHTSSINLFSTRRLQLFGMTGSADNILLILGSESDESQSKIHRESPSSTGKKDGQQSQKYGQIRQWIASTAVGREEGEGEEEQDGDEKSPRYFYSSPTKLLYAICNKLRPIRTSPDYMLRIRSASEEDANLAAFAMFHLARCYSASPSSPSILTDRRFEQLVECILCQLHIPKDLRGQKKNTAVEEESTAIEAELASIDQLSSSFQAESSEATLSATTTAMMTRQTHHSHHHRGLTMLDASHAVWALSKLLDVDSYHTPSISRTLLFAGIFPQDIIMALGQRCIEVLQQPTVQTIDQHRQTAKDIAFMIQAFSYAEFVYYTDPNLVLLSNNVMDLACMKLFTNISINTTNTYSANISYEELEQGSEKHIVEEKDDQRYVDLLPDPELVHILWYLAIRQKKRNLLNMEHITLFTNITKQAVIARLEQQYHQLEQRRKFGLRIKDDEKFQSVSNEKDFVSAISAAVQNSSTEDDSNTNRIRNATADKVQTLAFEDGVCVIDYNTSTTDDSHRESNDDFFDEISGSDGIGKEDKPLVGFEKIAFSVNISETLLSNAAKDTLAFPHGISYNITPSSTSAMTENDQNSELLQAIWLEEMGKYGNEHEPCLSRYSAAEMPAESSTFTTQSRSSPNGKENGGEAMDSMKEITSEEMMSTQTSLNTHCSVAESDDLDKIFTSIPFTDLSDSPKINVARSSAQQYKLDFSPSSTFNVEKEEVTSYPTSLAYVAPTSKPSFSGSDICSILWSVSELDGNAQLTIMETCLELLLESFDSELWVGDSADLVTVIWSIAKFISASPSPYNPQQLSPTFEKINRILEIVLSHLLTKLAMGETSSGPVSHFDLMRLIPSLESIYRHPELLRKDNVSNSSVCINSCAVTQLCTKSLMSAVLLNKDLFSVVELTRLVSSVISLNINLGSELSYNSAQALGCLQTIIEASLLNTVTLGEHATKENSTISDQGFIVPFLGKSRWIRSNVMMNANGCDVDKSIAELERISSIFSASIHLMYCLCQYSGRQQTFFAGGVIRFFALCIAGPKPLDEPFRMLLPIEVTKLLWACAKATSPQSTSYSSASREASHTVGRKLLHELIRNKDKGEGKENMLESFITDLDASYQCKFLWSLSKLYGKEMQQERSNGKQLSLCCSRPWEETNDITTLSDLSNLLWAMSHLGMLANQKVSDLNDLLSNIERKLSTASPDDLFFLFESLIIARRSMSHATKDSQVNEVTHASSLSEEESDDEDSKSQGAKVREVISLCDQVIMKTIDFVLQVIPSYTCLRLRQLLEVYGTTPLVIGNFLVPFEEEVKVRLSILSKYAEKNAEINPSAFLEQLQERAQDLCNLFYKITGTSFAYGVPSTLREEHQHDKKKIRWNIFASPPGESSLQENSLDNNLDDSLGSVMDDVHSHLRRLSTVMNETATYFTDMERLKVLPYSRFSPSFYELGKCQALVRAARLKDEESLSKSQLSPTNSSSDL